jgi:methylmalonyl-CoA mutase N-terminal domain/subunit
VQAVRAHRDSAAVEAALGDLRTAAADERHNLMPLLLSAARTRATEGELVSALQGVWGSYTETPVF